MQTKSTDGMSNIDMKKPCRKRTFTIDFHIFNPVAFSQCNFTVEDGRDIHGDDDLKRQRNPYSGDQIYSNVSNNQMLYN